MSITFEAAPATVAAFFLPYSFHADDSKIFNLSGRHWRGRFEKG